MEVSNNLLNYEYIVKIKRGKPRQFYPICSNPRLIYHIFLPTQKIEKLISKFQSPFNHNDLYYIYKGICGGSIVDQNFTLIKNLLSDLV